MWYPRKHSRVNKLVMLRFLVVVLVWTFLGQQAAAQPQAFSKLLASKEQEFGGRIGVMAVDISSGRTWKYRPHERFPMMSTFKPLACAHMLTLAENGAIDPGAAIPIHEADLVPYAPVTASHVGGKGLSLLELCEATLRTSDNVAANLVLRATGGPSALTEYIRSLGDQITRLDRVEVELNEAKPGDPRDTTTPAAMVGLLKNLLLGQGVSKTAQEQLKEWMVANAVSDTMLRSVLPDGWRIADRSGAGQNGSRAISAVVWKNDDTPILVGIYITQSVADMATLNKAIAEIGDQIFNTIATNLQ